MKPNVTGGLDPIIDRPSILESLKEFFKGDRLKSDLETNPLSTKGVMAVGLEDYLDKVEKLPTQFQAVTTFLRLDAKNPHWDDFEKNLKVAKIHYDQWKDKPLEARTSEMYYFPIAGQWGERTWETIRCTAFDFFAEHHLQTRIVRECEDPDYRRLLDALVRLTDDHFTGPLRFTKVRSILSEGFSEDSKDLPYLSLSNNEWIVHAPLHDPEFREEILDLTTEDLRAMAMKGHYCTFPEVWKFNARAVKGYRAESAGSRAGFEEELSLLLKERTAWIAAQEVRAATPAVGFAQPAPGEVLPDQLPGFYYFLLDFLEDSGEGVEFIEALSRVIPIFFGRNQIGSFGYRFGNYYLLDNLVKVTGSAKDAISLLVEANATQTRLVFTDWLNIIKNYEQVRGVDLEIAAEILRNEED